MLKLFISKDADKFLRKVPTKHGKQIALKITELQHSKNGTLQDTKKLKNSSYLRADAGEYRIIYEIQDSALLISLIGKRNDSEVYKRFQRKPTSR